MGYRYRIWKLQRERARALRKEEVFVTAAEQAKDQDRRDSALAELFMVKNEYDDRIASIVTRHLLHQAERYMLPVPEYGDEEKWEESRTRLGARNLTRRGAAELRHLIREHKRYEREKVAAWVTMTVGILGAMTGFVGTLIAYAALNKPG